MTRLSPAEEPPDHGGPIPQAFLRMEMARNTCMVLNFT